MPVFDAELMFRTTGNLTTSESSSGLKIHGTPIRGMAAYFVLPSSTGTTNNVTVKVWASEDDSTYRILATYPGAPRSWASGALTEKDGTFVVPIVTTMKYVKSEIVIAGSTGVPNFGVAKAGVIVGVGWDWKREERFE
jgi:hypothetical protein